jgi:acyl-CoA thioester hydrolase
MDGRFEFRHIVADDEIDWLGHANNVVYVDWMQSASIAHSESRGWSFDRYSQLGCGWVAHKHSIEYLRPAFAGDEIVVTTWVAALRRATSIRRYRIDRPSDGVALATAETLWAFIDYHTGQPVRIPQVVIDSYPLVEDTTVFEPRVMKRASA